MSPSRVIALAGYLAVAAAAGAAGGCEGCDGGGFADAAPADSPPPGTISLTWLVTDANGQPISCDQIGAQAVTLSIRQAGAAVGETAVFSCTSGGGTTQGFGPGTYVVDFELVDTAGRLAMLPRRGGVVVESGRDTPLGESVFEVDAVGGLDLFLRASGAMSNCLPANQMGAGWNSVTIQLIRPGGVCQPGTITVGAGATRPGGMYTLTCPTPAMLPCIESDQQITAMGLPSDAYTIQIRGRANGNECWINNDPIQVPALGRVLSRTLNVAKKPTPGC
jgi:hypothetical protein